MIDMSPSEGRFKQIEVRVKNTPFEVSDSQSRTGSDRRARSQPCTGPTHRFRWKEMFIQDMTPSSLRSTENQR